MTTLNFSLHPAQHQVFISKARFRLVRAGRRFGKTHNAIVTAITEAMNPLNVKKKSVLIVAPTLGQVRTLYWDALVSMAKPITENVKINDYEITLVNGVKILLRGADREDGLRGLGLWFVVCDEAQDLKDIVWSVIIRPALADVQGRALIIFTPKGLRNWTYLLWQQAEGSPDWEVFHFHTADNPHIPRSEIESARAEMSSQAFKQEFEADFLAGSSNLFLADWFKYADREPEGEYFIACDLAGFKAEEALAKASDAKLDNTAISVVKIDSNRKWWVKDVLFGRWGVQEVAQKIVQLHKTYQPRALGIEKGALRNAVLPYIEEEQARQRTRFNVLPLYHNNKNKLDRILWALQGRFEHGSITLNYGPWNTVLADELLNLGSKGVHDDLADSLSYIAQLTENVTIDIKDLGFDFDDFDQSYEPLCERSGY